MLVFLVTTSECRAFPLAFKRRTRRVSRPLSYSDPNTVQAFSSDLTLNGRMVDEPLRGFWVWGTSGTGRWRLAMTREVKASKDWCEGEEGEGVGGWAFSRFKWITEENRMHKCEHTTSVYVHLCVWGGLTGRLGLVTAEKDVIQKPATSARR